MSLRRNCQLTPISSAGGIAPQPVLLEKSLPVPKGIWPTTTLIRSTPAATISEIAHMTVPSPPATITWTRLSASSHMLLSNRKPGFCPGLPSRMSKARKSASRPPFPSWILLHLPSEPRAARYSPALPPPDERLTKIQTWKHFAQATAPATGVFRDFGLLAKLVPTSTMPAASGDLAPSSPQNSTVCLAPREPTLASSQASSLKDSAPNESPPGCTTPLSPSGQGPFISGIFDRPKEGQGYESGRCECEAAKESKTCQSQT
mmetsp:Transcript_28011/g.50019  ORF Transcript_28011/g.50019 Transcript_28011/m.50019 type:complete len:261 (-) Transcript_28011:25-807(-)